MVAEICVAAKSKNPILETPEQRQNRCTMLAIAEDNLALIY